jgi:hypothetical protein
MNLVIVRISWMDFVSVFKNNSRKLKKILAKTQEIIYNIYVNDKAI